LRQLANSRMRIKMQAVAAAEEAAVAENAERALQ
jgi:hypothetical protein